MLQSQFESIQTIFKCQRILKKFNRCSKLFKKANTYGSTKFIFDQTESKKKL